MAEKVSRRRHNGHIMLPRTPERAALLSAVKNVFGLEHDTDALALALLFVLTHQSAAVKVAWRRRRREVERAALEAMQESHDSA